MEYLRVLQMSEYYGTLFLHMHLTVSGSQLTCVENPGTGSGVKFLSWKI